MLAEQQLEVDRLGHVAADLEVGRGVGALLVGADDQRRGVHPLGAQLAQGVDPGFARHHRVEQQQVRAPRGVVAVQGVHHLLAVRRGLDLVAGHLQPGAEQQQDRLRVVGDQDPGHQRASVAARPEPALSVAGAAGRRTRKLESLAGAGDGADRAPVQLDQGFRDRQAEAGAAHALGQAGVAAGEAVEDVVKLLLRHARPVVAHGELHFITGARRCHPDRRSLRGSTHAHS